MVKRKRTLFLAILCFCFTTYAWGLSLEDAQEDYLSGDYQAAVNKARRLRETDQSLYFLGLTHIKTADYAKARVYLRKLIKRFPDSELHDAGMMKLADTYFLQKDYDNAAELYKAIESRCPKLDNKALLFLRQAQIASRQGNWEDRKKYLKLIKSKYSNSPEMKFVEVLESYGDFFTVQAGAFSEKKNALSFAEELTGKNYPADIFEDRKGPYTLYKVRVGRYKSRYEAEKISSQLMNEGYPVRIYP